jgi:acylaminoacyl-peptidase
MNGTKLVWLEHLAGGPHHSCFKLMSCNWYTKEVAFCLHFTF